MVVTRATNQDPLQFDHEIEVSISRLRREVRVSFEELPFDSEEELEIMPPSPERRTLKELTAPKLDQQPLCIVFPALAEGTTFELKFGLIHLLPSFHGLEWRGSE